ncbi:E3 ubiquitin-protein ligase TRAIP-like isoform X2 [Linepithema humile]|uniref:E3 ubiquitin-protein ligase TRAIP-like isoform X2 n=1 Tax=Linepithema humile TaxID=83485 RepID=UPI00351F0505
MVILCNICHDRLISSAEVSFTNCGHVFHLQCINQWLNRAPTCPQCRETITKKRIHRVYLTYLNETTSNSTEDLSTEDLKQRIDNLNFQILLKDTNIEHFTSKNAALEKQNAELRQEVRNVESEINKKNSKIYDLKEKIIHLNELSSQYKVLEEQLSNTKKKLDEFQRIKQTISDDTLKDVMKIVEETKNPKLINYICAMKKTMIENENKITNFQYNLKWQSKFYDKERKELLHLKQYIKSCKNEKLCLQNRIYDLEELLKNSEQNCIIKSNSQRNSNNRSLGTPQPKKNIYNQTDTRQETENQNDLLSPSWIEVVTDMNEEERTLDTTLDKCPSSIKKAKLSLQSGNDSSEINNMITHDGNISSMDMQSKKKKLKVRLLLLLFMVLRVV